jgi:hypothetical protein
MQDLDQAMSLKILCSGFLVRYPVGGHSWHHLQYLAGFKQLGHEVTFFEDFGWPYSCYNPCVPEWSSSPAYGVRYTQELLDRYGLGKSWCYLAEDGSSYGMSRSELAQKCAECDVYFNLSNINWIPELELCRRRVLVDTDPVFTQIGGYGFGGPFSNYHRLFTYAENIHKPGSEVPTAGQQWLPTRQPVVLDLWPSTVANPQAPITTVINWSNFGEREYQGRIYGHKDKEFARFFQLPKEINEPMEVALAGPDAIFATLKAGGWSVVEATQVTKDPWTYQQYIAGSCAEFCVAKHAYVTTRSGWFSDRTSAYLAMGRPAVVQDTGFSDFLPCGRGLLPFSTPDEAKEALKEMKRDFQHHCRGARAVAEEAFDARKVLGNLLDQSL